MSGTSTRGSPLRLLTCLVVGGWALAACGGCVRYVNLRGQQESAPDSDWFGGTSAVQESLPPLESGSVFNDFRRNVLGHYEGLGRTNVELWVAPDVSGDMITDNVYAAAAMFIRDCANYFLCPGDAVHIVPWDIEERSGLRKDETFTATAKQEEIGQKVAAILPGSSKDLAQGRPPGTLLTDAKYAGLNLANRSQDRTRTKLVVILTNVVADNPTEQARPQHTDAEVRKQLSELTNGSEHEFRQGEWKPEGVKTPPGVKLYAYYVAGPAGSVVAPVTAIDRRREPPTRTPGPGPGPVPEPPGPSFLPALIPLILTLLALAGGLLVLFGMTVAVSVRGAGGLPQTSDLRFVSDRRGRLVANSPETAAHVWSIAWEGLGQRPLARIVSSWGLTIAAEPGVQFGIASGRTDRISLRPGATQAFRVFVGSQVQQVDVTVGAASSRQQALATILLAASVVLCLFFLAG